MPPSPLIKFGVPVAVAVVCVLGVLALSDKRETLVDAPAPAPVKKEIAAATPNTVGAHWNWDSVDKDRNTTPNDKGKATSTEPAEASDFPYSAEEIYLALEKIRVDDSGNLVLDEITLQSLHDALGSGHAKLTDEHVRVLQEIIQMGLPGTTGDQAAELVGNYQQYLSALEDSSALLVRTETVTDQRKQYEEMMHLRRLYLGEDAANSLYAKTEAQNQYMITATEIQADPDLSKEEKVARQQAAMTARIDEQMAAQGLQQQYQEFLDEKKGITERIKDEAERAAELDKALRAHFTKEQLREFEGLLLMER